MRGLLHDASRRKLQHTQDSNETMALHEQCAPAMCFTPISYCEHHLFVMAGSQKLRYHAVNPLPKFPQLDLYMFIVNKPCVGLTAQ